MPPIGRTWASPTCRSGRLQRSLATSPSIPPGARSVITSRPSAGKEAAWSRWPPPGQCRAAGRWVGLRLAGGEVRHWLGCRHGHQGGMVGLGLSACSRAVYWPTNLHWLSLRASQMWPDEGCLHWCEWSVRHGWADAALISCSCATKGNGSSWIFEPCLTWANALQRVQHPAFALVTSRFPHTGEPWVIVKSQS
jgi:hypothetical protein